MSAYCEELDVERMMEKVRESSHPGPPAISTVPHTSFPPHPPSGADLIAQDLFVLRTGYDIYHIPFPTHRKVLGPPLVLAKRLVRRLLTPLFERQVAYNEANARVVQALKSQLDSLFHVYTASLASLQAELDGRTAALRAELAEGTATLQTGLARRAAVEADHAQRLAALQTKFAEGTATLQTELARRAAVEAGHAQRLAALQTEIAEGAATLQAELARRAAVEAGHAQRLAALQTEQEGSRGHQERHAAILETLTDQLQELMRYRETTRERIARAERELRRVLHELSKEAPLAEGLSALPSEPTLAKSEPVAEVEFDYVGFEERFRGSEDEIKERQRRYLQHFDRNGLILDIGCGRGEFLELLREAGKSAKGVDANLDMVLRCKEKGLDVVHSDAFAYLGGLPDESVGGIFSAQVIEHLHPRAIIHLVNLCYRKLSEDGAILLETINPQCLTVFAGSFYADFTHVWPYYPESMRYLLESIGFTNVELVFSAPVDPSARIPTLAHPGIFGEDTDKFNRAAEILNNLIFGDRDYAIIGRK